MSQATTARRSRPPIVAIVLYTLRTCITGRRWVGLLLPAAAAVLFGALAGSEDGIPTADFAEMANQALFGLALPITGLVVGDAVLGAEVRSGAFAFTWLAPVPTWQIAVGRWLGGSLIAAACSSAAFALAALVAGVPESAGPAAIAGATGSFAYVAVFIAIGCIAKRAAAWSLGFVFLVERLLGAALAGIAQLSPTWESRAVFLGLSDGPSHLVREGIPQGGGAIVRLLIISIIALLVASRRLSTLRLSGSSD